VDPAKAELLALARNLRQDGVSLRQIAYAMPERGETVSHVAIAGTVKATDNSLTRLDCGL
jgi:hypothetical protein